MASPKSNGARKSGNAGVKLCSIVGVTHCYFSRVKNKEVVGENNSDAPTRWNVLYSLTLDLV